jgi:hypothetical protein
MFITQKLTVDAGFAAARAQLAQFVEGGGLTVVSQDAYEGALTGLIRVGPFGNVPVVSKLVQVRLLGPVERGGATTVWLRWEATGAASGLFPVLDADLMLTAEGPEKSQVVLNGCYRPPFGRLGAGLDRALMHRVASATIRALLHSIAEALASPEYVPAVA